jgi:hypothetical protein
MPGALAGLGNRGDVPSLGVVKAVVVERDILNHDVAAGRRDAVDEGDDAFRSATSMCSG